MSKKSEVKVLKGLEGVKLRIGMYAGSEPVQHMIKEAIDNCIDEYFKGICNHIKIVIDTKKNYMSVEDNGSGMPNDWNESEKMYNIEVLTSKLHAGTKFNDDDGETRSGMNGVGIKIITAISKWSKVTSERDGVRRCVEYDHSNKVGDVKDLKKTGNHGTKTEFIPDDELLGKEKATIDIEKVKETCKMRSYLNKKLKITLTIDKETIEYYNEEGIVTYLNDIVDKPIYGMKPIVLSKEIDGNKYELAFTYSNDTTENILGFANSVILDRGTHETGFKGALTRAFTNFINSNNMLNKKDSKLAITGEDIRKGLKCVINMNVKKAEYSSQTKNEISNKEIITHITEIFNEGFAEWLETNDKLMRKLCNRTIQFARASEAVKKAQEKIIKNTVSGTLSFSDKFTDCFEKDVSKRELFICEGDSAGGSIVMARSKKNNFQAVYRLRGKILNTIGKDSKSILNNKELNELIAIIFGTNDLKNINMDDVKFSKICILTDADADGLHITSLLLSFFLSHFPELIKQGYVYIALSPKYRITVKNQYKYFKNDEEYFQYKSRYLGELFITNNPKFTVNDVVRLTDSFMAKLNDFKLKYAINNDIVSMFLRQDKKSALKEIKENGISVKGDYCVGLYDDVWVDMTVDEEFYTGINELKTLCKNNTIITFKDIKEDEFYECDIIDFIIHLSDNFKFKRYRFKGLGEVNPEELASTTLDPNNRDIIQVQMGDMEKADGLNQILFGSNTDKRKEFIQERL